MEAKKSKKLVITILIIATVLGALSIGAAYYFNNIDNLSPTESSATEGCGCYYIDTTSGISSCSEATTKDAFEYKVGVKDNDGKCSTICDLRLASETTGGTEAEIISCNSTGISATPGCLNLSVKNSSEQNLTTAVPIDETLSVKAYFRPRTVVEGSDPYTKFSFVINGEKIDIDVTEATVTGEGIDSIYEVSTEYSQYGDADKLSVQAFGDGPLTSDITSEACIREYDIAQPVESSCNVLDADITLSEGTATINEITLNTSGITDAQAITSTLTFSILNSQFTTNDLKSYYSNGTIILDNEFLYSGDNFIGGNPLEEITLTNSDKLTISAEVYADGSLIESSACSSDYEVQGDSDITTQDTDPVDDTSDTNDDTTDDVDLTGDTDNTDDNTDPTQDSGDTGKEEGDTSAFSVVKTGTPQCLERETPNNQTSYTITITNADETYEDLQTIVDKLPLGFTYVSGSSTINGTAVADADYVTVETVGSAEQITWSATNNWSVAAGDTLTITFSALVNTNALTGDNMNEVVITPVNTPISPTTLRTEFTQEVSQNCSTPETGLFDSMAGRIITSMIVIMLAFAFYYTNAGSSTSLKIASSDTYKGIKLFGLKITDPKKHFEEKIRREADK